MISFSKEQIIIVTGASSGIGRATALLLNELGASIVGIGRNIDKLNDVYDLAKHKDRFFIEQKDLTDDIEKLPLYITELRNKYGKFYGLVCSAGVTQIVPIKSLTLEESKKIFDINYFSPLFTLKGFCDKRNNIGAGASVVMISSTDSMYSMKGMSIYSGSKAALKISSECAAREYDKIRINIISPSDIETPMNDFCYGVREARISEYPLGFGKPEDVANMCAFLLSNKSSWVTGSDFLMTGGL